MQGSVRKGLDSRQSFKSLDRTTITIFISEMYMRSRIDSDGNKG